MFVEHLNTLIDIDQGAKFAAAALPAAHVGPNAFAGNHTIEGGLMLLSLVIAVLGSYIGWRLYNKGPSTWARNFTDKFRGLYNVVHNKYFVDEFYFAIIVWPFKKLAWLLWRVVDFVIIDSLAVRGSAFVVDVVGRFVRQFQTGSVQHYVAGLLVGLAVILYMVSQPPDDFRVKAASISQPGAPLKVMVGERVFFDARPAVDKDKRALEYRWDFDGDGKVDEPKPTAQPAEHGRAWSIKPVASFSYPKPGRYRVVMDVRDKRWGTDARETRVIDVIDPNAPKKTPGKKKAPTTKSGGQKAGAHKAGKGAHSCFC